MFHYYDNKITIFFNIFIALRSYTKFSLLNDKCKTYTIKFDCIFLS